MAPHCSLEESLSVLREASRSLLITRGFDHVKGKEIDDLC